MKRKFKIILLLGALAVSAPGALAQYTGGSADGYTSSRSDDILYDGAAPIVTGEELPDVVHHLTIDNPAGVTLSKNITVNGILSLANGDLNLNGHAVTFGENAVLQETPGNTLAGADGNIAATRTLNNLTAGQNVGNLGLEIKTGVPLGETTVARGHTPQPLTPDKESGRRFFDVTPTNDSNLDATVDFHYDVSELNGVPEADLALFISHNAGAKALLKTSAPAADTAWEFLGGTVNGAANTICKGGIGGFSRLTIARGFVLLADQLVKIENNKVSEGDIHSNGKITFEKGEPGKHTGNLTAVDDITIGKNNTIVGDAIAGDDLILEGNAAVTGTAKEARVARLGLTTPSFTAKGNEVTVPKKGALTLPPGSYGEVEVKKRGTLFLTAGDYFMDELETDAGAVLSIDVSNGAVNINVVRELEFDEHTQIVITPSGQAASNQVAFTTLQHKKVEIGEASLILGWIYAPKAEVHFAEECRFKGAVVAQAVIVDEEVIFVPHSSSMRLSKPTWLAADEEDREIAAVVTDDALAQNYPNPFNPATTIRFSLKEAGAVRLTIFNLQGQEVRTLISMPMNPGQHAIIWDGRDNRGQTAPSGVYLYRLSGKGFVQTKKMSFVK